MKIKIIEVGKEMSGNIVAFSTEFGDAKASWNGDLPETDKEYFVEFEIPDILSWGEDITRSEKNKYAIRMEDGIAHIAGILESFDEDGYTVVRLGENIITFETDGSSFPLETFVVVKAFGLVLFDINY